MAGATLIRASTTVSLKAEPKRCRRSSQLALLSPGPNLGWIQIFAKIGRAVTQEALINRQHRLLLVRSHAALLGKMGRMPLLVALHAVVIAIAQSQRPLMPIEPSGR